MRERGGRTCTWHMARVDRFGGARGRCGGEGGRAERLQRNEASRNESAAHGKGVGANQRSPRIRWCGRVAAMSGRGGGGQESVPTGRTHETQPAHATGQVGWCPRERAAPPSRAQDGHYVGRADDSARALARALAREGQAAAEAAARGGGGGGGGGHEPLASSHTDAGVAQLPGQVGRQQQQVVVLHPDQVVVLVVLDDSLGDGAVDLAVVGPGLLLALDGIPRARRLPRLVAAAVGNQRRPPLGR